MPTDCNPKAIEFTPLGRRAVVAGFDGGRITSDAGALLLREVAAKLRLFERMSAAVPDPRDPDLVEHEQRHMLAQRVLGIACGWEDLNDHHGLRLDPLVQAATGRGIDGERPMASPATLCRLENRAGRGACVGLSQLLVELFVESFGPEVPEELVLDFDATDDPVHGDQEGRFFHGYYDGYCFLPLYVFCGERLLVSYLRPANIDAAKHSRAILKLLVDRLRQAWPGVRIIFRGDSGFCRWRLLRLCDRRDVKYVVGLARNKTLERIAAPAMAEAERLFKETGQAQRSFHAFRYAAGTWDRERRVIHPFDVAQGEAEHNAGGDNPRFVVTNLADPPAQLYDGRYCPRGDMENRVKEQQLGLFADRTSCHAFAANQFRLLMSSFAYVLIETLRRTALAGTELAHAQATTVRLKLLKVGAVVVTTARRVVLRLSAAYPLQALFADVARRLVTAATPVPAAPRLE